MGRLWLGMIGLRQTLTIWPDPMDLLMTGSKLFLDHLISASAASMGVSHLQIVLVDKPRKVITDIVDESIAAVLKRDYSASGRHFFSASSADPVSRLEGLLEEEAEAYNSPDLGCYFPHPRWFIQPFNPGLTRLGEVRTYLVNGILFGKIITTPRVEDDALDLVVPILFTPLSKLRSEGSLKLKYMLLMLLTIHSFVFQF